MRIELSPLAIYENPCLDMIPGDDDDCATRESLTAKALDASWLSAVGELKKIHYDSSLAQSREKTRGLNIYARVCVCVRAYIYESVVKYFMRLSVRPRATAASEFIEGEYMRG